MNKRIALVAACCLSLVLWWSGAASGAADASLKRPVPVKSALKSLRAGDGAGRVVFKLAEAPDRPAVAGGRFVQSGAQWDRLNAIVAGPAKAARELAPHIPLDPAVLDRMRQEASARVGWAMPDLTRYYELRFPASATAAEKLAAVNDLNALDLVEIAFFQPDPEPASGRSLSPAMLSIAEVQATPNWENNQYYLKAAPIGVNAYYAWNYPGGKGETVRVIDIEGNWIETHEDLHGGTDNFHIAGTRINDAGWWNHGTAVLGEIAADSNSFGMTGIAFNVDLGTVSIGSMSTAAAITTAVANSEAGDVFLIELHAPGPHYDFEPRDDQAGYVPMEYWQDVFDAILQASALGRIVVEAGGNGNENLDDVGIYGQTFDPAYRFSGAIMVGATSAGHVPASFTNYGQRVDVHAFGTWDVYTLGYGSLYGTGINDSYTGSFSGTSSASPIITGSAAVLQGINKATHGTTLYHNEIRSLMQTYGTPQAAHYKHVGPLPDLQGATDQVIGVSFSADTTIGWAPFDVAFTGSSGLEVTSWTWDFGDGDSAFVQDPVHTYEAGGQYTVRLEIMADGQPRVAQRVDYVAVLADTMVAPAAQGGRGDTVIVPIYARNNVPLTRIDIPVEYPGDILISSATFNTVGCRTSYFQVQDLWYSFPGGRRMAVRLQSSVTGTAPPLEPGAGPIVNLVFVISPEAEFPQSADVKLTGYGTYLPAFSGPLATYTPVLQAGTLDLCPPRGDLDGSPGISVADITYLVGYLFRSGPPPAHLETADVNCDGSVKVSDLTYLINYLFRSGPDPCAC
ncbi:MAG TPA: S8 family serine peptidase [candidate division Zixibacteria bacterium]|nr:S8 family serine peptidase [candidate division Zixibacteria bacterium]MDD4918873.1 S8 family serine peptidase [candidate division Zixibacteria bacterium]MDM7973883.1 S8 family serine peptidase [candidate division Zixibacteria bacterium]HPM35997.1 S8 family serine peptidase [candidate division Zixibacteria bacterium]